MPNIKLVCKCGFTPVDTQYIIGTSAVGSIKDGNFLPAMWFCPACTTWNPYVEFGSVLIDSETIIHSYISTACLHGNHDACRLKCKYCSAKCLCPCGHLKERV